jgi:hypothetical protein
MPERLTPTTELIAAHIALGHRTNRQEYLTTRLYEHLRRCRFQCAERMSAKHEALILLQDVEIAINKFHKQLDDNELTNLDNARRCPQCAWRLVLDVPGGEEPSQPRRMDTAVKTEPVHKAKIEQPHVKHDKPVHPPELRRRLASHNLQAQAIVPWLLQWPEGPPDTTNRRANMLLDPGPWLSCYDLQELFSYVCTFGSTVHM